MTKVWHGDAKMSGADICNGSYLVLVENVVVLGSDTFKDNLVLPIDNAQVGRHVQPTDTVGLKVARQDMGRLL